MKRRLTWALAAILVLSLTGSAYAAAGRVNPPNNNLNPPPSSAKSEVKVVETAVKPDQATGTLTSIDAKAMTLVLKVKAGPMHFKLSPTTEYLSGGTTAELATLSPGANVRIEYRMEGTSRVATKIEVLPAAR
jgi:hypothetical protein